MPREQEQALREYAAGLEAYCQQSWDDALGLFTQSLTLWPGDTASRTMAERCQTFRAGPPLLDWDGSFEQTLAALEG